MNPFKHPLCNAVLNPPPDAKPGEVLPLPICRVKFDNGTPAVWSFWQPSLQERHALSLGASVCVSVLGHTLAPMMLGIEDNEMAAAAAIPPVIAQSQAARDVLAERQRHLTTEGWTPEHDDEHDDGSIGAAAAGYALAAADILHPQSQGDGGYERTSPPPVWPGDWVFKPSDPRRMLVKAAALAIAEIERLDRATRASGQEGGV